LTVSNVSQITTYILCYFLSYKGNTKTHLNQRKNWYNGDLHLYQNNFFCCIF